jgi:predicted dehydrogenase
MHMLSGRSRVCSIRAVSSSGSAPRTPLRPSQTVRRRWPDVRWIEDQTSLLRDPSIDVIVTAAVSDQRSAIAVEALTNGKDVVTDKPGCVTLDQLDQIEKAVTQSGRFWSVTFSERFEVRCASKAGQLVRDGRIGRVVQTLGLGPRRVTEPTSRVAKDVRTGSTTGTEPGHHHRHGQPPDRPVLVVHRRQGR